MKTEMNNVRVLFDCVASNYCFRPRRAGRKATGHVASCGFPFCSIPGFVKFISKGNTTGNHWSSHITVVLPWQERWVASLVHRMLDLNLSVSLIVCTSRSFTRNNGTRSIQNRFFANFSGWKHWGLAPAFRRRTGFVFDSSQSF